MKKKELTFHSKSNVFRCKLENYMNDSYEIQGDDHKYLIDKYIPFENNSLNEFDKCKLNQFINGTLFNSTYKCDSWVFSNKYYSKTIVNDVCKFLKIFNTAPTS